MSPQCTAPIRDPARRLGMFECYNERLKVESKADTIKED